MLHLLFLVSFLLCLLWPPLKNFSGFVFPVEYMSLPASQYSVLDAERIERVDDNTFRCYVYRFKFFAFEVCPVLLVKVEEQPNGCCIQLLSCKVKILSLSLSPSNVLCLKVILINFIVWCMSAWRLTGCGCSEWEVWR